MSRSSKNKPILNTSSKNRLHGKPALTRSPGDRSRLNQPVMKHLKHSFAEATVKVNWGRTEVERQAFRQTYRSKANTTKTVIGKSIAKNKSEYRSRSRSSPVSGLTRQLGTTTSAGSGCRSKPAVMRPPNSNNSMQEKMLKFTADQNKQMAVSKQFKNGTTINLKTPFTMKNTAASSSRPMKLKAPLTEARAKPMATTLRMKTFTTRNATSEKISHKFTKVSHNRQRRQSDPKTSLKAQQDGKQRSVDLQFKGILKKESSSGHQHDNKEIVSNTTSKHVKFRKSGDVQQASLRAKLNDWLQAKGKTPGHCRHLNCFDAQISAEKKKPKPVYGRLSGDVLEMQENTLKREEVNSRKRLFDGRKTSTPSKAITVKHVTPRESSAKKRHKAESTTHILAPSDIGNKLSNDSSVKSPDPVSEEDNLNENHCVAVSVTSSDDFGNVCNTPHQPSAAAHSSLNFKSFTPPDKKILDNLNSMLQECLTLFKDGCSLQNILPWLHEMETNIPQAQTFAPYYICKAELFKGNPSQVLDVFCQAVENNAQPADMLAKAMRDLLSQYCASFQISPCSPLPIKMTHTMSPKTSYNTDQVENLISVIDQSHAGTPAMQLQNHLVGDSDLGSTVKYCVTPGRLLPGQTPDSVPLAKVTPIRRSLRLSNRQQTPFRKEIESMSDLTLREAEATVYQPNPAFLE